MIYKLYTEWMGTLVVLCENFLCFHARFLFFILQSTPLHLAAGYNRTGIVQRLLQHGADVHAKDKGYVYCLNNHFLPAV